MHIIFKDRALPSPILVLHKRSLLMIRFVPISLFSWHSWGIWPSSTINKSIIYRYGNSISMTRLFNVRIRRIGNVISMPIIKVYDLS